MNSPFRFRPALPSLSVRHRWLALLALLLMALPAVAAPSLEALFGRWQDRTYVNPYFGFGLKLPAGLHRLDDTKASPAKALAKELAAINDPALREQVRLRYTSSLNLVHVGKFQQAKDQLNPNLAVIAVRKALLNQVKTPVDFLKYGLLTYEKMGIPFTTSEPDTVAIGGKEFAHMRTELTIRENKLIQDTYCLESGDYFLSITCAYTDLEQGKQLQAVISSVRFR